MLDRPYFMENEDWYYFDFEEKKFKLTDKANNEAKESYKAYYEAVNDHE